MKIILFWDEIDSNKSNNFILLERPTQHTTKALLSCMSLLYPSCFNKRQF